MSRRAVGLLVLVAAFITPISRAAEPASATRPATAPDATPFIRYQPDGRGGGTLETAIATYRNADGIVVHLVAAVHVGERSYFSELSKTFETYDALLYELVKPKDAPVPGAEEPEEDGDDDGKDGRRRKGPEVRGARAVGGLQTFLTDVLKLDFQLDAIDYDRPNFVHADLDAETFNSMQEDRDETLFGLMLRSMLNEMRRAQSGQGAPPITMFDILAAMKSPDSARQYKLLLAPQFTNMEAQVAGMEGGEGTVLVTERNKAALRVLKRTVAKGTRSIGVFYGAAHMRGIEDVLVGEMGFKRTALEWRVAWDMRAPATTTRTTTTTTTTRPSTKAATPTNAP